VIVDLTEQRLAAERATGRRVICHSRDGSPGRRACCRSGDAPGLSRASARRSRTRWPRGRSDGGPDAPAATAQPSRVRGVTHGPGRKGEHHQPSPPREAPSSPQAEPTLHPAGPGHMGPARPEPENMAGNWFSPGWRPPVFQAGGRVGAGSGPGEVAGPAGPGGDPAAERGLGPARRTAAQPKTPQSPCQAGPISPQATLTSVALRNAGSRM
jgi:hypothetical protein